MHVHRQASSLTEGCDLARFHLRSLHDRMTAFKSRLDRAATLDLRWWAAFSYTSASNGVLVALDAFKSHLHGCQLDDWLRLHAMARDMCSAPKAALQVTGYIFDAEPSANSLHITHKELRAVIKGIRMNADALRGTSFVCGGQHGRRPHHPRQDIKIGSHGQLRDLLDLLASSRSPCCPSTSDRS